MTKDIGTRRYTTIMVAWWDHGDSDRDWAYHLRMGDIDADYAEALYETVDNPLDQETV